MADRDEKTISALLLEYGITHEPGPNGTRYLKYEGETIGTASAQGACVLIKLLEHVSA